MRLQRRLLEGAFQRLAKHAGKLVAAAIFAAGAGTAAYYVTSVESGPEGALITYPADNATLTTDADGCDNGFHIDVVVRTNAANGTAATLTANGLRVAEASVSAGSVTFPDVQLGSRERHVLVAKVGGARAVSAVTVACAGAVQCRMAGPTWSPEAPALNGAPRWLDGGTGETPPTGHEDLSWIRGAGDRASGAGVPYQLRIEGLTSAAVASTIEAYVDGTKVGQTSRATGGTRMVMQGVHVPENDGDHSVYLKCLDPSGAIGFSTRALFDVDTQSPQLAVLTPQDGVPGATPGGKLRVCASTTSADALDLSEDLRDARQNLCVAIGTSAPTCAAMTVGGAAAYWESIGQPVPAPGSLCDGAVSCQCDRPCPARWECTVDSLTGCETLEKVVACRDGQEGGYDPISQVEICTSEAGTEYVGTPISPGGCPEGTTLVPVGTPSVPAAGYCQADYECRTPGGDVVDKPRIYQYVSGAVNPTWGTGPYAGDPQCLLCKTTWICPYSYTAERDGGCITRHITKVDGTTLDETHCVRTSRCAPAGCDGCPVGTTITPGTGIAYTCVDGADVIYRKTIPCADDATVVWTDGCYECSVGGTVTATGCVAVHTVQVDGACRACEYQLAGGGTSTTPWQCPQCNDNTRTGDGACVELDCPGPGEFDLHVSLYDGARNATSRTIQAVRCVGAPGPSVEIVDPIGGSRLELAADISRRVLAATTTHAPRRDSDPDTPGAQYTVVACTDATVGSTARLYTGLATSALTQHAEATVTTPESTCHYAKPNEARFAAVTLPESREDGLGRITIPTRIRVDVTEGANVGSSPVVDLWVDSTLPTVALEGPIGCGATLSEAGAYPLRIRSSALPVTVTITNSQGTQVYTGIEAEPGL